MLQVVAKLNYHIHQMHLHNNKTEMFSMQWCITSYGRSSIFPKCCNANCIQVQFDTNSPPILETFARPSGLCIGFLGAMIGFPLHSSMICFPIALGITPIVHCTYPHFRAFEARSILWCNGTFNLTTKGVEGLKNEINVLPMIGGQSKSIETTCLTNDMHIIMFIPGINATNCAFDARSIFWCNGTFNSNTKGVKWLKIGIDVLLMTSGQSKSIETKSLTNDMHGMVLIPKRNVANSRISFPWIIVIFHYGDEQNLETF